jgi:proton-dependent oligopeptide transporter, POT family
MTALSPTLPIPDDLGPSRGRKDAFFGHPTGLGPLAISGAFERFAYYGMQSLLVLYMTHWLLQPGHIEHAWGMGAVRQVLGGGQPVAPRVLASYLFGIYSGLAYLTPILGGAVADRWTGKTGAVIAGASLMAVGHLLMAFEATFLPALACLLVGLGGLRSNLAGQIGALYPPGDLRRSDGFQIYMFGVQVAGVIAPLVCGSLGQGVAWRWGFLAASLGMTLGLLVYLLGLKSIPTVPAVKIERAQTALSRHDIKAILFLAALLPLLTLSELGNQQTFNTYIIWGEANYQLAFGGWTMPITWLLSFGGAISTVVMALSVAFWRVWARRRPEPSEFAKLTLGACASTLAPLVLALASQQTTGGHKVSLLWALAFHVLNNIGFAHGLPVALSLFSRLSPRGMCGTMIALCYLHLFAANLVVGWLGGIYQPTQATAFWLAHAGLIGLAAVGLAIAWLTLARDFTPGRER